MEEVGLSTSGVKTAREETGTEQLQSQGKGFHQPPGASRTFLPLQPLGNPSPPWLLPELRLLHPELLLGTPLSPIGPSTCSPSPVPLQSSSAPLQRKAKHSSMPGLCFPPALPQGS